MSGSKEDDRKGSSEWREFFWNPRTHELLGRTAASWGQYHGIRARLRESVSCVHGICARAQLIIDY